MANHIRQQRAQAPGHHDLSVLQPATVFTNQVIFTSIRFVTEPILSQFKNVLQESIQNLVRFIQKSQILVILVPRH